MGRSGLTTDDGYQSHLGKISEVYATGQARAAQAVNTHITETYWQIGHDIVEFEQGGNVSAEYGKRLVASLAKDFKSQVADGLLAFKQHHPGYKIFTAEDLKAKGYPGSASGENTARSGRLGVFRHCRGF